MSRPSAELHENRRRTNFTIWGAGFACAPKETAMKSVRGVRLGLSGIVCLILIGNATGAKGQFAQFVRAGLDGFHTNPGSHFTLPSGLPAGFFGIKSGTPSDAIAPGSMIN